ncbi:hypothetical protein COT72_00450 [archaeon CG10_big_fil_rev_8_21_14_0_10_43_11]|nr:MAG: hypothetical protein COT72_00450 [archaeon CG10_big_fil_rev_8_21_14_0_10_43_11]
MAEEDLIIEKTIQYDGVYEFKEVYATLSDVLITFGYDIKEKKQVLKSKGSSRSHEVEWECTRNVDKYTRFLIKFKIKANVSDTSVEEGGKKMPKESGDLKVEIKSSLVTDYAGRWEGSPYSRFLKSFFDRFLYGKKASASLSSGTYKQWIVKLSSETQTVIDELKALLHLYKV